jgi:hypothetical protein
MMTPLDRKVELLRREISAATLAKRAGVTATMVRAVLNDKEKSRRVRVVIARAIGRPVAVVFGNAHPPG